MGVEILTRYAEGSMAHRSIHLSAPVCLLPFFRVEALAVPRARAEHREISASKHAAHNRFHKSTTHLPRKMASCRSSYRAITAKGEARHGDRAVQHGRRLRANVR